MTIDRTKLLLEEAIKTQSSYSSLRDVFQTLLKNGIESSSTNKPTKSELVEILEPLENWELLAHHLLGMSNEIIKRIKLENKTAAERKFSLVSNWLLDPEASWKSLVIALVKCENYFSSKLTSQQSIGNGNADHENSMVACEEGNLI